MFEGPTNEPILRKVPDRRTDERTEKQTLIHRTLPNLFGGPIKGIDLQVFCDASLNGVSGVIYATVTQDSGQMKGVLASKSRLSKKNQSFYI